MCFIIPIPTIYHSSFVTYHRICSQSNTMGVASGAEIVYPSGAPAFTPSFSGVHITLSVVFCAVFCRSLFVRLSFFCLPLCCLFFFDLQILITPLKIGYHYSCFSHNFFSVCIPKNLKWEKREHTFTTIHNKIIWLEKHEYCVKVN